MARSQILIDLVNSDNNIESVLMRMKVILFDLNNTEINKWIDSEIEGYEKEEDVPRYRILTGQPYGDYNYSSNYVIHTYKDCVIPVSSVEFSVNENIRKIYLTDSLLGITNLLETKSTIENIVPTVYYKSILTQEIEILKMSYKVNINQVYSILANIKSKLTSIILTIEKDYGNLDSLDVFSEETNTENIEQNIINIIYDQSIEIGDNNNIKSSEVGNRGE
ncbi:hypothetical protein J2Z83_002128 [Virgibacillus natechei]|uniref:AbiTii domain-containing protein n=1 Tax=Virgibacillus natechei TaxID=1216297 RepID=A0ABS4IGG4_9BACI|nr:hypothetical protein [Virgibacillus natechei]MBP1970020.1 hypothetical protein [Virgibacillus natechei]UZD13324.1 hypothetical protein OLD84_01810 [Virgibacillus natechei]